MTNVKIWYDKEGDFLEILFSEHLGYLRETAYDAIMERVDDQGNLLGFSILGVSQITIDKPILAELVATISE